MTVILVLITITMIAGVVAPFLRGGRGLKLIFIHECSPLRLVAPFLPEGRGLKCFVCFPFGSVSPGDYSGRPAPPFVS